MTQVKAENPRQLTVRAVLVWVTVLSLSFGLFTHSMSARSIIPALFAIAGLGICFGTGIVFLQRLRSGTYIRFPMAARLAATVVRVVKRRLPIRSCRKLAVVAGALALIACAYFAYQEVFGELRPHWDGKLGFRRGYHTAIPQRFNDGWMFTEGCCAVKLDKLWGYIDENGEWIIKPQYEHAYYFTDGLAGVKTNGKYGFIDKTGQMKIPPAFDDATPFSEQLATVSVSGKYGYINIKGEQVIPPKYDSAFMFWDGRAVVRLDGKEGVIDRQGQIVVPFVLYPTRDE